MINEQRKTLNVPFHMFVCLKYEYGFKYYFHFYEEGLSS